MLRFWQHALGNNHVQTQRLAHLTKHRLCLLWLRSVCVCLNHPCLSALSLTSFATECSVIKRATSLSQKRQGIETRLRVKQYVFHKVIVEGNIKFSSGWRNVESRKFNSIIIQNCIITISTVGYCDTARFAPAKVKYHTSGFPLNLKLANSPIYSAKLVYIPVNNIYVFIVLEKITN